MLRFVIEMPPEGCSHSRAHKQPYVASEIFAIEIPSIVDQFFTSAHQDALNN